LSEGFKREGFLYLWKSGAFVSVPTTGREISARASLVTLEGDPVEEPVSSERGKQDPHRGQPRPWGGKVMVGGLSTWTRFLP